MPMDFTSTGVVDVDAFLATTLRSPEDETPLVSNPPPVSPTTYNSVGPNPADVTSNVVAASAPISRLTSSPTLPPPLRSPPPPQDVLDKCRAILVPLVERNAKLRYSEVDEETVRRRAYKLLSDKLCSDFVKLAKQVREQISGQGTPESVISGKRKMLDGYEPPGSSSKIPKLEPTMKAAFAEADEVSPASLYASTPTLSAGDTLMGQDSDTIFVEGSPQPLSPGTGTDNILSPSSRIASPSLHGHALNGDRNPESPPVDREAYTETPLPIRAASHSSLPGSRSPSLPAARHTPDETALQVPSKIPTNNDTTTIAHTTASPPSPPHSRQMSPISIGQVAGAATHEADHATSDSSRHDSESVTHILDPTAEDGPVAHESDNDMHSVRELDTLQIEDYPPCPVPGVWFNVAGQPSSRVESIDFFVDNATADAIQRWSLRKITFRCVEHRGFRISSILTEVNVTA